MPPSQPSRFSRKGGAEYIQASTRPKTVAANPQGPRMVATASDTQVQTQAIQKPHSPGMRPEGIGRCGSLIASTWRSYQSLIAWLVPQTSGPATSRPAMTMCQRPSPPNPVETMPQEKAQIGANQVTGFSSSSIALGCG